MIRISKLADYAVVILTIMASSDEELMSAAKLSTVSHVPEPTVSKILKMLSKGGIIESTRGIHGGYALSMKPSEITVENIIYAIDGPVLITECANGANVECSLGSACKMRGRWNEVNRAILLALSSVSLRSIMFEENQMCMPYDVDAEDKVRAINA
jgi:FeS assembly SUF system regulator